MVNSKASGNWRGRWLGLGLAAAVSVAITPVALAGEAAASTPSCYGDYCSGQNPYDTGCANDAYEWGSATLRDSYEDEREVGDIALWISKACGTRWSVLTLHEAEGVHFATVQQDGGYSQEGDAYGAGRYYTEMTYSRDKCSFSRAQGVGLGNIETGCAVY